MIAIALFLLIVLITVGITIVAARRTKTAADYFVAGGRIGGFQNGLAVAGDFMSAATLLGMSALMFVSGFDVVIYMCAPMAAFALLIFLFTDKLKALGKYTFTDILCARLNERPIRILAATTALVFSIMYLMVQVVGAGALIEVLFGIRYLWAVLIVTGLMVLYVAVGGMIATTWVQITKAVMLILGVAVLAILALIHFDFDFAALYATADAKHGPGGYLTRPGGMNLGLLSSVSLGLSLMCGLAGSPHLLMRFFTVPNAAEARKSAGVALCAIALVNVLLFFVIGIASVAAIKGNPNYLDASGQIIGGINMVSVHLAHAVGGEIYLGIMASVTFATILAVVAGLTLASVSAISHDLYANAFKGGRASEREEVWASRLATLGLGVVVVILGLAFEKQNIAYLITLALAIGASTNFPLLLLAIHWRGFTTRGALAGGTVGLVTAIALILIGPSVWVGVLGNEQALFSEPFPALYSMVAAVTTMWFVSKLDGSERGVRDRENFSVMTHPQ